MVVGGSVAALSGGDGASTAPDPATPAGTSATNPAFSYGNEVFYDGPARSATIDDTAVKSLFYTSAGVLVRHGDNAWSDGGGPQRFSLVDADGDVHRLGLETEETVHAADPAQPYVVYGEAVDGQLDVVVYDVEADEEAARVEVAPTEDSWFPVSLDGDTLYVQNGYDGGSFAVDWRTGDVTDWEYGEVWEVAGGHAGITLDSGTAVIDAATGEVLLQSGARGYFDLSPDGRYAQLVDEEARGPAKFEVYDVASTSSVEIPGQPFEWGWSADGDLFQVTKDQVRTCSPVTGECTVEPYAQPAIPQPPAVTQTMRDPVCPADNQDCFMDEGFLENCAENPDQCEWQETEYVEEQTIELKLGGRAYES
ncbi:hypothetical protein [Nocardioides stalactiti]|uniref:hypothetical protein n=1 Tax=Nocardioides stalactiti TaxID=2755356 RepID=UPI0016037D12|nr:hypothetical protein [Nocardioides stalactiti]